MPADASEIQEWLTRDMRENPENWMWLWEKIVKTRDGRPVPIVALREFWGLPLNNDADDDGA